MLVFDAYSVLNYLQDLGNPQASTIPGFNPGCCNPAYTGTYVLSDVAGAYSQVIENTHAGYLTLSSSTTSRACRFGSMPACAANSPMSPPSE